MTAITQRSSALLYGAVVTPVRSSGEPSGPLGSGRLVARPKDRRDGNHGYWEVGWIGSEVTLTVFPMNDGPQHLWCRHARFRRLPSGKSIIPADPLLLTIEPLTNETIARFGLSTWGQIPTDIQELIRNCCRTIPSKMNGSNSPPLA